MVKQNFVTVNLLCRDACHLFHYCLDTELIVKPASIMQGLGCTLINNSLMAYAIVGRIPVTLGVAYLLYILLTTMNNRDRFLLERDNYAACCWCNKLIISLQNDIGKMVWPNHYHRNTQWLSCSLTMQVPPFIQVVNETHSLRFSWQLYPVHSGWHVQL